MNMVSFASFLSLAAASILAGCGNDPSPGASDPTGSSSQPLTTSDADADPDLPPPPPRLTPEAHAKIRAQMLEHARCMRAQGLDWPDPPEQPPGAPAMFFTRRGDTVPARPIGDADVKWMRAERFDGGPHVVVRLAAGPSEDGGVALDAAFAACVDKLPHGTAVMHTVEAK